LNSAAPPALFARLTISVGDGAGSFTARPEISLGSGVLVLFGPSGSGKTLTLQAIAGLLRPSAGLINAGGEALFDASRRIDIPAHKRRIGYVPQQPSLFPFATVAENVAFGLPRAERRKSPAIIALMDELGIGHLADARPASLSGGERQRVALARALAVKPRLLLLDEPFASIDRGGRATLRRALLQALRAHGTPAVFVTHDEEEAIEVGDSLVLLERGTTVAAGSPASLLRAARPVVVSGVIEGSPSALDDGRLRATLRDAVIEGPADWIEATRGAGSVNLEAEGAGVAKGAGDTDMPIRLEMFQKDNR
jgi:molybdate transport system ATP-binding protein